MVVEITTHFIVPVIVGILIGIIEAFFVYEDENMTSGKDFLGDMWHGLLFAIIGVVVASNIPFIMTQDWFPQFLSGMMLVDSSGNSLVASILITLFMMIKMVASHAIKGVSGGGFSEKLWHKLAISLAIGFAPYYLDFFYAMDFFIGLQDTFPWAPL